MLLAEEDVADVAEACLLVFSVQAESAVAGVCFAGRQWRAEAAGTRIAAVGLAGKTGQWLAAVGVGDWQLVVDHAACWLAEHQLALVVNSPVVEGDVAAV